jgi:hypothetical protein
MAQTSVRPHLASYSFSCISKMSLPSIDVDISCLEPLMTWDTLCSISFRPISESDVEEVPLPFACKVVFNESSLLQRVLLDSPFDITRARNLIAEGADPNMLIHKNFRPILSCTTVDSLRFLLDETSFDPSLCVGDDANLILAAAKTLPPRVFEFLILGNHVERLETSRGAPFFDANALPRDMYRYHFPGPTLRKFFPTGIRQVMLSPEFTRRYGSLAKACCPSTGTTMLHITTMEAANSETSLLLAFGCDPNAFRVDGTLAIHYLHHRASDEVVGKLLDATTVEIDFFLPVSDRTMPSEEPKKSLFQKAILSGRWKLLQRALDSPKATDQSILQIFDCVTVQPTTFTQSYTRRLMELGKEALQFFGQICQRWKIPAARFRNDKGSGSFFSSCYNHNVIDDVFLPSIRCRGYPVDLLFALSCTKLASDELVIEMIDLCDPIALEGWEFFPPPALYAIFREIVQQCRLKITLHVVNTMIAKSAPESVLRAILGAENAKNSIISTLVLSFFTQTVANGGEVIFAACLHQLFFPCAHALLDATFKVAPRDFDWSLIKRTMDSHVGFWMQNEDYQLLTSKVLKFISETTIE